jgi:hypothetical protein
MPRLLHRSEKFEIHETEDQTFRHGLACADRVAKSNLLVGRHFDGPFIAGRRSASPNPLPGYVAIDWPGRVDGCLGGPDRKPGSGSGAVIEIEQLYRRNQGIEKLYIVWE